MDEDLVAIDFLSGINDEGRPFVTVIARSGNGHILRGELAPGIAREMGVRCFQSADDAEADGAVFNILRYKGNLDITEITGFIVDVRTIREDRRHA